MVSRSCSIRLIRKSPLNRPRNDDRIIFRFLGVNIAVEYWDGHSEARQHMTLTRLTLRDYVSILVRALRADTDPFEEIQFNFPGFPVVVYSIESLTSSDVTTAVKDMAEAVDHSWRHIREVQFDDSDSDSDETGSDGSSTTITIDEGVNLDERRPRPFRSGSPAPY